ncbi:very short patch repair endonuclease [Rhizobium leguminosarum]|uniref:very short patch repair endonuclease n=1 Tax=Rhizobium leguminosarum TaxID=384 RepID=UPI003F9590FC
MSETPKHRSWQMSRIRSKDTKPEMQVRRIVHALGYRYRLHRRELPGKPDLVFGPRRKVIFVHGCFWHHHDGGNCRRARMPKSRLEYWEPKLQRNVRRDAENLKQLCERGWNVLVIWECQLANEGQLRERIIEFLEAD